MDNKQVYGKRFSGSSGSATAATATIAAVTNGVHYITDISGGSAMSTATLTVLDGSNILWQVRIGNSAGYEHSFVQPLASASGNAVSITVDGVAPAAAGRNCFANIAGYTIS